MTLADHLSDEVLSVLVDEQLSPAELQAARVHLEACTRCTEQLAELRRLKALLGDLPELDLPRDFALGPRLVADPPNVIRLERWYTWTRAGAASLAAAFVFLVAGTVYVDTVSPPRFDARTTQAVANAPKVAVPAAAPASAPATVPTTAPTAAVAPAAPPQSNAVPGVPAAARDSAQSASAPASAGGATAQQPAAQLAARSQPSAAESEPKPAAGDTADQTAAATRVQPLPTLPPTPVPQPPAAPVASTAALSVVDPAAPLRTAAVIAGVLAVLVLLGALVVRHRLSRARAPIPLQE